MTTLVLKPFHVVDFSKHVHFSCFFFAIFTFPRFISLQIGSTQYVRRSMKRPQAVHSLPPRKWPYRASPDNAMQLLTISEANPAVLQKSCDWGDLLRFLNATERESQP